MKLLPTVLLLPALLSSGCAGILHGTSDTLSVNSMEEDTIIYVDGTPRAGTPPLPSSPEETSIPSRLRKKAAGTDDGDDL